MVFSVENVDFLIVFLIENPLKKNFFYPFDYTRSNRPTLLFPKTALAPADTACSVCQRVLAVALRGRAGARADVYRLSAPLCSDPSHVERNADACTSKTRDSQECEGVEQILKIVLISLERWMLGAVCGAL